MRATHLCRNYLVYDVGDDDDNNNNVDNDKGFVTMVATMGIQLVHLVLVYKD